MDWGLGRFKDGRRVPQIGQFCPLGTLEKGTEGALGQGCPFFGHFCPLGTTQGGMNCALGQECPLFAHFCPNPLKTISGALLGHLTARVFVRG
jgi:hypothetical protein